MKELIIKPFEKCGPINNGDSFLEISKKYSDHKEFKKSPFSKHSTSSIFNGNVHVFYSELGKCVGVEVFPPLSPIWSDISFISGTLKSIVDLLKEKNIEVNILDSGLDIPSLGILLYSHDFDESLECVIDSVYVNLDGQYK